MPSGLLGLLPLPLAEDPATRQRLLDRYEIIYAPSLLALARAHGELARQGERKPSLAAVVNPTGDLSDRLAPIEGLLVAAHFPKKRRCLLDAENATPETVLAALKGKTIWHFATHGTFSPDDARRSALMMKDLATLSVGDLIEVEDLGRPRL